MKTHWVCLGHLAAAYALFGEAKTINKPAGVENKTFIVGGASALSSSNGNNELPSL
jgi:hypothetical protein